jgi:hypothetical protein
MANLHAWRNHDDGGEQRGRWPAKLVYRVQVGQHLYVAPGERMSAAVIVPDGLEVVFDLGRLYEGEVRYSPFDDSRLQPRGTGVPAKSDDRDYVGGVQVDVVLQQYGHATFLSTSNTVVDVLEEIWAHYATAPEAQREQLPVYIIAPPREFTTRHGSTLYAPGYKFSRWVVRPALNLAQRVTPIPRLSTPALAFSIAPNSGRAITHAATEQPPAAPTAMPARPVASLSPGQVKRDVRDRDDEIPF